MNTNKSASLEARLSNSKDLISIIKDLELYDPSAEDIRTNNYESYVEMVNSAVTPMKEASALLKSASNNANSSFSKLVSISKNIRSEMLEYKLNSEDTSQVNSIVRLITGENVSDHSRMKKKIIAGKINGEDPPKFSSVSAMDRESQLGNFRTLIALLKTFGFYDPTDKNITVEALELFEKELNTQLKEIADREIDFTNERSKVIQYFSGENGLNDRARRAKLHVKRKYGKDSPEYRMLINRKF